MNISDKLKSIIFKKLYQDLSNVEIIPYKDSIWFIDRENEYWYFEFENGGTLYWRYTYFPTFFSFFSMDRDQFEPILSEWVEEVLNSKVFKMRLDTTTKWDLVDDVLKHKVSTTCDVEVRVPWKVEEVLNYKVSTTEEQMAIRRNWVEEVLNHKVSTTAIGFNVMHDGVEEVLNHKVNTPSAYDCPQKIGVEEVLNHKVSTTKTHLPNTYVMVEEVLNHKVFKTYNRHSDTYKTMEEVLNHKVSTTKEMFVSDMVVENILNSDVTDK